VKPASIALLALFLAAPPRAGSERTRLVQARALVAALHKGDFVAAGTQFDATMKRVLPEKKLEEVWRATVKQLGAFQKITASHTGKVGSAPIIDLDCKFEKQEVRIRVAFDREDRIQGFFFQPPRPRDFPTPSYARREAFREEAVTVGAGGDWPLPGTLALPKGKGPFPAVVLLHGSGPQDRDETIGPNKPFRDIAWGLASRDVAVLRFDKRTRVFGAKIKVLTTTLEEEVIADALLAVKLLSEHREIDPKRLFVLGHSLGGMATPRVGALAPQLRGVIVLAGNTRPLEDLILDQFRYLFSLDGGPTKEQKEQLERLEKQVARVRDAKLTADTPARDLPLGIPAAYWLSLRRYDQKATAAKLAQALLILQGERDYQVTMEDFAGWKKALAGRKDVTLRSYPALNHLFQVGKGKATPEEYNRQGHVAAEVVEDVAAWVKKQR
jgi:dienelactone hydrolase